MAESFAQGAKTAVARFGVMPKDNSLLTQGRIFDLTSDLDDMEDFPEVFAEVCAYAGVRCDETLEATKKFVEERALFKELRQEARPRNTGRLLA